MINKQINQELIYQIVKDDKLRKSLTYKSHFWFFHIYLNSYVIFQTAKFQKEIFSLTEDENIKNLIIVAFRGSAKSTILTTSLPIWSVIGAPQKKFVLIIAKTQQQAKDHFSDIKMEFENNEMLKSELGPFKQEDTWSSSSLILTKYNAKITSASIEQSIRGMKFGSFRPQLIICDDVEDINSIKTQEGRDKTHKWYLSEVLPLGSSDSRIVTAGNLLHNDGLISRLKQSIENKQLNAVIKAYPIADENGDPIWPGQFKDKNALEKKKADIGDVVTWQREYMLKIIPDQDQLIKPEIIKHYDKLPDRKLLRYVVTGVDLAVSQKDSAHYTAMVSAYIYGYGKDLKIYILPRPVNERLEFPQIVSRLVLLNNNFGQGAVFYVEKVAAQEYLIQSLKTEHSHINVKGISVAGSDKRTRLSATTHSMELGKVLFPKQGAELLIQQLQGFGSEKYDDLCDAFSLLVNETTKIANTPIPEVFFV